MAPLQPLRFGIVQGRLVRSPPGALQWFPQDCWQSEFFIASSLGIDYIELIAERQHNDGNPLWNEDGVGQIRDLVSRNRLTLHALCNDFIIDHALPGDRGVLDQCLRLVRQGAKLGCEKYVLPLFEASELTAKNGRVYSDPLRAIADEAGAQGMTVCLETILTGGELVALLDFLDHPNIAVVYDTGNRVAFGHDLPADIRLLGPRIRHVHIKDKDAKNQNVLLGTGLVNFKSVFEALADIVYRGPYTFETQRGTDPARTARYNMEVVSYFFHEAQRR
jgi:sugar phosphate isomerase/epimerase